MNVTSAVIQSAPVTFAFFRTAMGMLSARLAQKRQQNTTRHTESGNSMKASNEATEEAESYWEQTQEFRLTFECPSCEAENTVSGQAELEDEMYENTDCIDCGRDLPVTLKIK